MRYLFTPVVLLAILTFGIPTISVSAQTFNTNLTVGSRGTDVVFLQQFLVAKGFLQMPPNVAYGYFGPLTRVAVARWQTANGITPAVGYFGPISRAVIVAEINTPSNLSPSTETDAPAALGMRANQVMLFRAFPFEVRSGDVITLDGSGFSKTINKIYFNDSNPVDATSTDGITLDVRVPLILSEGEYSLSVSNTLGSSNNPDIAIAIKITNNPRSGPIIENASIVGDTVTLTGSGFTSANNIITTLGDSARPISSNSDILTFRITELSMYNEIRKFTLGKYQAALWIYVQNEHGANKEPYKLEIMI